MIRLLFCTEYHYNRHLLSYTPPPPLLPPSRLNHRLHYRPRSYSPPHRCFRSQSPPRAAISPNSAHSDDLDIDKLSRRPRTSITVCQREFLEGEFQKERYPTLAYIDKLSRKVHLQQYVIKVKVVIFFLQNILIWKILALAYTWNFFLFVRLENIFILHISCEIFLKSISAFFL